MAEPSHEQYIPRNYWLGIANGALVMGGFAFLNVQAVVAVFLLNLGASPVMIGFVSAASFGTMMLLPLPFAPLVERAERKKVFYVASAVGRVATLSGLVASVWLLRGAPPWLLGGVVVAMMIGYRVTVSVGILPFYEIVAHSVPTTRRGAFFSTRRVVGNAFKIGGAFLVGYLLDPKRSGLGFPANYATIFTCGLVLSGLGAVTFCFAVEPRMHVDRSGLGLFAKLREGFGLIRCDRAFRRLVVCQLAGSFVMLSSPFLIIYCLRVLDILKPGETRATGQVGSATTVFLLTSAITFLVANPVWARISDRKGNASVLRGAYAIRVLGPLLALMLPLLPMGIVGPAAWGVTPRWIGAVVAAVVTNVAACGVQLGALNYMLELAPLEHRPRYMALWKVATAPVILVAPLLGGWIATSTDAYWPCFVLTAVFAIAAAVLATTLHEPRERAVAA